MKKEKSTLSKSNKHVICKSKGCNNPVIKGKHCQLCKQKRKEVRARVLAVGGSTTFMAGLVAIKKGAIKQGPKIAEKVIKVILKV